MITTTLWKNLTLAPNANPSEFSHNACIVAQGNKVSWLGPESELPAEIRNAATEVHDLKGAWVTPGLVDCHTHLVFGANRADEFAMRLDGASYEEISRRGGGIMSSVRATRQASEAD